MHPQSESSYTPTALGPAWPAYDFGRGMSSLRANILITC